MIIYTKNFLWWIVICYRFNLSSSQTKEIKNLSLNKSINTQNITENGDNYGYIFETKNFLFYKSNVIYERSCACEMEMSCSCCESVVLLFTKSLGQLCGNLMYRPEGLNVNITLDGNTIRSMTVTNYRPLKICALIPKSLFSIICLNILELNLFPRSITACPRLEIATKNQNWKINYTCVSISTPMASEVDSLIVNNSNRLTNSGAINPLTILGNQTVTMLSVSPPKQTQSQLSAVTPEAINLLNSNISIIEITSETIKASPTSSSMINFIQSSNPSISPTITTSPQSTPLTISSDISSTSSVIISSRNLPYTATTKLTCKKVSEVTKIQTNFRNYPITTSTSTTLKPTMLFTPHFEDTISPSPYNTPNTTNTTFATTKQSSISFNTSVPLTYSSLVTESAQNTLETDETITNSILMNTESTLTINTTTAVIEKIVETLNNTLTPEIFTIPLNNYSNEHDDKLNSDDKYHFSTTYGQFPSNTKVMENESTETILDDILITQTITNNTNQHSNDQSIRFTILDSLIESLENKTSQNV